MKTLLSENSLVFPSPYFMKEILLKRTEDGYTVSLQAAPKNILIDRDVYVLVDISGTMWDYYHTNNGPSKITKLLLELGSMINRLTSDGMHVLFFSRGLVQSGVVRNAIEIEQLIGRAISHPNAFRSTRPIEAFEAITHNILQTQKPGLVLFLTDGALENNGNKLRRFYNEMLNTELGTRDRFFCLAIELGHEALDTLQVLRGRYGDLNGNQDLFEIMYAEKLDEAVSIMKRYLGFFMKTPWTLHLSITNGLFTKVNMDQLSTPAPHATTPLTLTTQMQIVNSQNFDMKIMTDSNEGVILRVFQNEWEILRV